MSFVYLTGIEMLSDILIPESIVILIQDNSMPENDTKKTTLYVILEDTKLTSASASTSSNSSTSLFRLVPFDGRVSSTVFLFTPPGVSG